MPATDEEYFEITQRLPQELQNNIHSILSTFNEGMSVLYAALALAQ
jgi:hypothetical protein